MRREPWFWREDTIAAQAVSAALSPAAALYAAGQAIRMRTARPYRAPVPVVCIGNASLGGVGKTPFAIALAGMLSDDLCVHFATRGYGGTQIGPLRVDPARHSHAEVGDEALLLAQAAPTFVAKSRAAGARAASAGADLVIMDDGFQNPTVEKTVSILLLSAAPSGSLRTFPAGPWRERPQHARARADIVVAIGDAAPAMEADFQAALRPAAPATPRRVYAFAGIGAPARFFAMLKREGHAVAGEAAFPDHHPFTEREIAALREAAGRNDAELITTEKDFVRIPQSSRDDVLTFPVRMAVSEPDRFLAALRGLLAERPTGAAR